MQLMIDIAVEQPEALDLAADFLKQHAALKRAGSLPAYAGQPFGSNADVPAGTSVEIPPPPPVVVPPPPPPASNVVPFPVPAPPSASVGESSAIPPAPPAALIPTAPNVPAPTTTVAPPTVSPASSTDEYDSSGFPFDARIHQKTKGKKKDGTWKLQKNLDLAIVTAVTTEIAASGRMRPPGAANTPSAGASSAPVAVPGTGAMSVPPAPTFVPSATADTAGSGSAVPVPPPPAIGGVPIPPAPVLVPPAPSAAVPVPPAPYVGMPDAGNAAVVPAAPVNDFRSFVAKVTAARTSGKITAEQVAALIVQAGAPSLQLLNSMPHLIGTADAYLDAHLAMV